MGNKNFKQFFFKIIISACFSLCVQTGLAQQFHQSIDKKSILIGEQINYNLQFVLPSPDYTIEFNLPDSFPHFDFISKVKSDSTDSKGNYMVMQKIVLTSFDSGQWQLPSLPIRITNNTKSYTLNTDSILINVGYAPADSTGKLRDIKPVMDVFVIDNTWLYIIGAVITAIILFILLYRYFKRRPKKQKPIFQSSISPYDEAIQSLKNLSKFNLQLPAEIKEYHTELAAIFKKYFSRKDQRNLLTKTTSDILLTLNENGAEHVVSKVAESLRCSDAVKFAKYLPSVSESENNLQAIKDSIDILEKNWIKN
jgi:hypothetical protein